MPHDTLEPPAGAVRGIIEGSLDDRRPALAGDLLGSALRRGIPMTIRARGGSMLPFLLDGDALHIVPAESSEVRVGDVICYEGSAGAIFIHRVIARRGQRLVTRGDALTYCDAVSPARLLGRVTTVERHGRPRSLDTALARLLGRAIVILAPLTLALLPLGSRLRRLWRAVRSG